MRNIVIDEKDGLRTFKVTGIGHEINMRQTHCLRPTEKGLTSVIECIENCLDKLAKDAPRAAIRELEESIVRISEMAPLINPTASTLGGGISENLKNGEKVGKIEKTHLIINRIMREEAIRQGTKYIDVGTDYHYPFYEDYLPTQKAIEEISQYSNCVTHYPSSYGLVELRQEFKKFLKCEFDVDVDFNREIMVSTGASQVFDAVSRAFSGEYFIIPDLALPTVSTIAVSNGAKPIRAPLKPDTGYIDIRALENILEGKGFPSIRFMYINYPTNPSGAIASKEFFEEIIEFSRKHRILLVHDMDSWRTKFTENTELVSLLQLKGGKDVGITVFSVSKEFGMPGLRIGLVAGNREAIEAIRTHNSLFCVMLPEINQYAVVAALREYCEMKLDNRKGINKRIESILNYCIEGWKSLGWPENEIYRPYAGYKFLLKVPPKFKDTKDYNRAELFTFHVVDKTKVKLSNSTSFNPDNSEYIRMIIMQDEDCMEEVFERLRNAGIHYDMYVPDDMCARYKEFLESIESDSFKDF